MIAPTGIGGRATAAGVGTVDDIIVNQRRAVKKFDDCGKADRARAIFSSVSIGE